MSRRLTFIYVAIADQWELFYISDDLPYHLQKALPTPELRSDITEFSVEKLYCYRKASYADYPLLEFFDGFVEDFLVCIEELVSISLFMMLSQFRLNTG